MRQSRLKDRAISPKENDNPKIPLFHASSRKENVAPYFYILLLFAAFFLIGLVTRLPAMHFSSYYALHGVFAAPFYAALIAWYSTKQHRFWPVAVASSAYGCVLGSMQPIMGIGALVPLALASATLVFLRNSTNDLIATLPAIIFGASAYPATITAGMTFSSTVTSADILLQFIAFSAIALGLAILGAFAGQHVARYHA